MVPSKGDGELRLRWLDDRTLAAMAADMQLAAVETYTVQQATLCVSALLMWVVQHVAHFTCVQV